jgi:hypothetical protein
MGALHYCSFALPHFLASPEIRTNPIEEYKSLLLHGCLEHRAIEEVEFLLIVCSLTKAEFQFSFHLPYSSFIK